MITKQQAMALPYHADIHCEVTRVCKRTIGARGGVKDEIVHCRQNGRCQTWKTRPEDFRLPVKHGMYESGAITQDNAASFHLAEDCPIKHDEARTYYANERPSERAMRLAEVEWKKHEKEVTTTS